MIRVGLAIAVVLATAGCGEARKSDWPEADIPPRAEAIPAAFAAPLSTTLCVMPVADGAPGPEDIDAAWRMASRVTMIPGSDRPWIAPVNRGGEWTIDASGRYVPFGGERAGDPFDVDFVTNVAGDVYAVSGNRLLRLDHEAGTFAAIGHFAENDVPVPVSWLAYLPRRDVVLVSDHTRAFSVTGDTLTPWAGEPGAFTSAFDLPGLAATLFGDWHDGSLGVLRDDDAWLPLDKLEDSQSYSRHEYVVTVESAPGSGPVALVETNRRWLLLRLDAEGAHLDTIARRDQSRDNSGPIIHVAASGEVLIYRHAQPADVPSWQRLTPTGWEAIPGPPVQVRRNRDFVYGRPADYPTAGVTLTLTTDGIAAYDGGAMRMIAGGEPKSIGWYAAPADFPSVGRVLASSDRGVFELVDGAAFRRVEVPFTSGGEHWARIEEAPELGVALFFTVDGLFSLSRGGEFERVPVPGVLTNA